MTDFTVGEYLTRDGRKAVVVVDWRSHIARPLLYPLSGYIEGDECKNEWTADGGALLDKKYLLLS